MRSRSKTDGKSSDSASDGTGSVVALRRPAAKGAATPQKSAGSGSRLIRRINLDLPEKPAEHLDWLQEETGAISTAEVIRTALKLYYGLACEIKSGATIVIRSGDGTEKNIKVFL